jgi:propanediol dehydratase large subunit
MWYRYSYLLHDVYRNGVGVFDGLGRDVMVLSTTINTVAKIVTSTAQLETMTLAFVTSTEMTSSSSSSQLKVTAASASELQVTAVTSASTS